MFNKKIITPRKDKSALSLPRSKTICGVSVSRMPAGAYIEALERLQNLPEDFIEKCFPGKTLDEVINIFAKLDKETLPTLMFAVCSAIPRYAVSFIASLTGVDEERLLNDPEISVIGLVQIVEAFIEVNELGEFAGAIRAVMKRMKKMTPIPATGSSGS